MDILVFKTEQAAKLCGATWPGPVQPGGADHGPDQRPARTQGLSHTATAVSWEEDLSPRVHSRPRHHPDHDCETLGG